MNAFKPTVLAVLLVFGAALGASDPKAIKATPEIRVALEEILAQFRAFQRSQGATNEVRCDLLEAWSWPGKIDDAASWLEAEFQRRGFVFSSEGQLAKSYAFTAISQIANHPDDVVLGGLIEKPTNTLVFLERCHPPDER